MKRLVKFFTAALWALGIAFASAAYADPPSIIGRLNHLNGPVSFAPGEAPDEWVAAQLNRPVTSGDRLWTDSNGFAEMRVGSLAVRMAPQTSMDILALDDRAIQLRVAQGNLNLRVRRLSGDRFIEVATPTGAVVIRQPGSYRISVDPQGDFALVSVRAGGQAEVFTSDASVFVRDNEEAELSGGRPELYAVSQPDEFDRWAADRDQRFDRIGSTRYVSMEMTGYEDLDYYGQWRTVGEYGNVWIPNSVPTGWAPYRDGHWVWVSPWGWTWVDDQPWGFAPSHYGRWVYVDNYWAWAPGRIVERPIYSPALVAFIGGAALSVGISSGPSVGWVPLGYREPYIPWYQASQTYVRNVNTAYVTNVTNITNVTNVRYVNRTVPNAVTIVPRETFVAARPVQRDIVRVDNRRIATAPITREAPVARPERTSLVRAQTGSRPPAQVISREAVTVHKPAAPQRQLIVGETRDDRRAPAVAAGTTQLPPVRVIQRREPTRTQIQAAPSRPENRANRQVTVTQAPRADAPAPQPGVTGGQTRRQEQAREQQGERIRDQKEQQTEQQKAQATQQLEKLERDRKQREGQIEQQRQATERERGQKAAQDQQRQREEQQRAQQERERGQKAAQDQQRQREEQQRAQQERERGQKAAQDQQRQHRQEQERAQRAQQERERGQKAAQDQQRQRQEQERAQQERERGQKAAQERQRQEQSQREQQQRAAQEQQRAQQEQQRAQQARQQQEQQRQRQEQERAQREQSQKAAQEQQRAQREQQQRTQQEQQRQQQAAQQRAQQEQQRQQQAAQQRAQQEQRRAQQQAAQKAAQEQQRAAQQQAAQKAAQEQQRAQQAAQQQRAAQQAAQQQQRARQQRAPEAEKGEKGEKGRRQAEG